MSTTQAYTCLTPEQGEHLMVAGSPMRLFATGAINSGSYVMGELSFAPRGGVPKHRHCKEEEALYVLSGRFLVWIEGDTRELDPGSYAHFPKGVTHAFKNIADHDAKVLVLLNPAGSEAFYREMNTLPLDADIPAMVEVGNKYGIEIVGPPL